MSIKEGEQGIIQLANKMGYDIGTDMLQNVKVHFQKTFDFLPELAMFIASYTVEKTFTRQTTAPKAIRDSIRFFFHNVFDDEAQAKTKRKSQPQRKPPYVRVFPSELPYDSYFEKGSQVKVVSIFIDAGYLKSFLKSDAQRFPFLFSDDNNFLLEEIMTDDILHTVNEMLKGEGAPAALMDYHYKLKAIELLYHLFQSLSRREKSVHQKLSNNDIVSIYKVRDKIALSLQEPSSIATLKQLAGMNELKMRKLFTQVFGMGIYDYYQLLRMKEAARLLREEKLSVSEAGYRMGFENLSHFSRVFEKHIGKKPKKYSSDL